MTRQTALGWLFLFLGVLILGVVLAPVIAAVVRNTPPPAITVTLLVIGVVVAVFGAWLLPSSGVPAAAQSFGGFAERFMPTFGRRDYDNKPKDGGI